MSSQHRYMLMVKTITKSKARFLKFFPLKSLVEGEPYEISFRLMNIGEKVFPGGQILFRIDWPSQQSTWMEFEIPPLRRNKIFPSAKFFPYAFSDGYGFVFIERCDVKKEQGKSDPVEFYTIHGKGVIDIKKASIYGVKSKSWEEIYEFCALIVASVSLAVIALEKIWSLLMIWIG